MTLIFSRRAFIGAAILLAATGAALAGKSELYLGKGWTAAINGYDAVSYFGLAEGQAPARGAASFSYDYKGAKWHFASAANRDKFAAAPESYAPQFGGYCAWALARNKLAPGDPTVWQVVNGKLYLNVNRSIQSQWRANLERDIANGHRNWPGVIEDKAEESYEPSGS